MANGDTKTEAMLNVLGNGGSGDEFRGCCNTKTQQYILDAIDRINSLDPGGGTDLPIKVLTDADANYTTDKPVIAFWKLEPGYYITSPDLTIDLLSDINETYYFSPDPAYILVDTGGDGCYVTYIMGTFIYFFELTTTGDDEGTILYCASTEEFFGTNGVDDGFPGLVPQASAGDEDKFLKGNGTWENVNEVEYVDLTMTGPSQQGLAVTASKYMDEVLDLAEANKRVVFRITLPSGTGYPTSGTYELPLFNYEDNQKMLAMTVVALGSTLYSIIFGYDLSGIVGDHTNVGNIAIDVVPTGGSGPTVVQTTGTSTTDVMSQDATTKMIYPESSTKHRIRISEASNTNDSSIIMGYYCGVNAKNGIAIGTYATGGSSSSHLGAIAIGGNNSSDGAQALGYNAVAIGAGAYASGQGVFAIGGRSSFTAGYNNTAYRLLTGLYDGQSDHDAATYGQMNTRLDGLTLLKITQTAYDQLQTKDPNTLYVITGA